MDCKLEVQKFRLNRLQYHTTMPYGTSSLTKTKRLAEMFVAVHEINVCVCVCVCVDSVHVCASLVQ